MPIFHTNDLQAVLDRQPEAVRRFIRNMAPVMREVVRRARATWKGNILDEDDLLQEIFMALFHHDSRALRRWDPSRGRSLASYLRVFAQFRTHDALSAAARCPDVDHHTQAEDCEPGPGAVAASDDGKSWIEHAVARYRDQCNEAEWSFLVRFVNGATASEMMTDFKITRSAFDQRVHRMRKRLLVLKAAVG